MSWAEACVLTNICLVILNHSNELWLGLGNHKIYSGTGSSKSKELHFASSSLSRGSWYDGFEEDKIMRC
jgi:hypothetical protein